MENELIYMIGEAILLEVEGVKDVTYPQGESPAKLYMEFENGSRFEFTLKAN
jgi:hypothetical protein